MAFILYNQITYPLFLLLNVDPRAYPREQRLLIYLRSADASFRIEVTFFMICSNSDSIPPGTKVPFPGLIPNCPETYIVAWEFLTSTA